MDTYKLKVVNPFDVNEIIDKSNFTNFFNTEIDVTAPKYFDGVDRDVIPVDMGGYVKVGLLL